MIPRKMSWRWYTPKARSSVARQEFLDLPPHGQAALLSLMKRYAEHDSRPGMVARVIFVFYFSKTHRGTSSSSRFLRRRRPSCGSVVGMNFSSVHRCQLVFCAL